MSVSGELVYFGHDTYDIYTALAVEDVLKQRAEETGNSYFRSFTAERPAAVVAQKENINDVKYERCREHGVDVTRRPTAGSVIWFDDAVMGYSLITDRGPNQFDTQGVHSRYGEPVAEALKTIGAEEVYIGDKFSISLEEGPEGVVAGNSAAMRGDTLIYHGVLVVDDLAVDRIDTYLSLREEPDERALIEQLPSLSTVVDGYISADQVSQQIVDHLADEYRRATEREREEVLEEAEALAEERYRDEEWIFEPSHNQSKDLGFCLIALSEEWQEDNFHSV